MPSRAQQGVISIEKPPHRDSQSLKVSLELANVGVQEFPVWKIMNKQDVYGRTPQRKLQLTNKNIAVPVKFAKKHIDATQNVLWTDKTNTDLF